MCSGLNMLKSCLSTFYAIIKISNMDCQMCPIYPLLSNVSRHLLCHAPGDQYCLCYQIWIAVYTLRALPLHWRHNGRDGVANHQRLDYSFSRLFRRRSKKTSKLRVTGLCVGNSPVTGAFFAQRASNAENVSIWWRHRVHMKQISFFWL